MAKHSPLYVLLATHERPGLLRRTLGSLSECRKPDTYEATVVAENGSKSGAEEIVRAYEDTLDARYRYASRGNKSHALNTALRDIDDGLIFFTDDDVRVHPEVLVRYAEAARGLDGGVYFGGPTDVDYEEAPPDWIISSLPYSAKGWSRDSDWGYALGFNWAAFATDLKACEGFNEERGPGSGSIGQETDMQKRLEASGVEQRFVDGGRVWHYVPRERCSPRWLLGRYYRMGKGDALGTWDVSGPWLGYNAEVWSNLLHGLRRMLGALRASDREKTFEATLHLVRHLGRMRGRWEMRPEAKTGRGACP